MKLPRALQPGNEQQAVDLLRQYYGLVGPGFTGRWFDTWDPSGRRANDADCFTSDDLVAVTFLSVQVSPRAAHRLLVDQRDELSALLAQAPHQDLVEVPADEVNEQWPAWRLWDLLDAVPDVGWVTAGKLLAYKRPRLIPVYDQVVRDTIGDPRPFWPALHSALRAENGALHQHLLGLRDQAGVPAGVSALRVFDVVTWMTGKGPSIRQPGRGDTRVEE